MDVEEKTIQIISDKLGVSGPNIEFESKFVETLGADSLDIVEMIMALEEEFGIEIPEEEAQDIIFVKDAIDLIAAKRSYQVS